MKITKYTKSPKESSLLGFFSMTYKDQYGERFINSMKLFQVNGRRFITHPDEKFQNEAGETKYSAFTGYTQRDHSDKFQNDVLKALDAFFIEKNKEPEKQQQAIAPNPHLYGQQQGELAIKHYPPYQKEPESNETIPF